MENEAGSGEREMLCFVYASLFLFRRFFLSLIFHQMLSITVCIIWFMFWIQYHRPHTVGTANTFLRITFHM